MSTYPSIIHVIQRNQALPLRLAYVASSTPSKIGEYASLANRSPVKNANVATPPVAITLLVNSHPADCKALTVGCYSIFLFVHKKGTKKKSFSEFYVKHRDDTLCDIVTITGHDE